MSKKRSIKQKNKKKKSEQQKGTCELTEQRDITSEFSNDIHELTFISLQQEQS